MAEDNNTHNHNHNHHNNHNNRRERPVDQPPPATVDSLQLLLN